MAWENPNKHRLVTANLFWEIPKTVPPTKNYTDFKSALHIETL